MSTTSALTYSTESETGKEPIKHRLIPPGWFVLVQVPEEKSTIELKSGVKLLLASRTEVRESIDNLNNRGLVIALGNMAYKIDGYENFPPQCKPGDDVLLKRGSGNIVKDGDITYKIVSHNDIIAILRDPSLETMARPIWPDESKERAEQEEAERNERMLYELKRERR